MIKHTDIIVDLQAGDTGKGKVAHALLGTKQYDLVVRYNGGANAGHTVYHNGQKIVTHQVPVGVLHGVMGIIGPGCVVNVTALCREIQELMFLGFNTNGLILVDKRAHLVTDKHLHEDGSDEKIGTTRQGIGPAYRDKYGRIGKRIGDDNVFSDFGKDFTSNLFQIVDIYEMLHVSKEQYRILCEGAQGFQIDIDWGDYPYVTSSHCTVGAVALNGMPPSTWRNIYGTMKAYETYSGFKTHYTDENNPTFQQIQELGEEYGATTGRKRKVRWLNLTEVIQAIRINDVTHVIISKIDILDTLGEYACTYVDGTITFTSGKHFRSYVENVIRSTCNNVVDITWSSTPNSI